MWQVPNSPELNILNLGAWAAVQAKVEEKHCKLVMRNNVLVRSVEYAFYKMLDPEILQNIWIRWKKVLKLVLKSSRGNELVEVCRGKKSINLYIDFQFGNHLSFDPEYRFVALLHWFNRHQDC